MAIKQTLRRGKPTKGTELSEDLLCKTVEFEVKDPITGCIDHTITPHKRQIGLDHPNYQADLVVKGVTLPEGGLRLRDDGYMNFGKLQGDLGIGLRAADDPLNPGTTTIQVRDEGGTWENISGGGGSISLINDDINGGISVTNGTGPTTTLKIDVNDLVTLGATIDTGDFVVIYDSDTASSKKALVSNLPFTNNAGTVTPSSSDTFTNKSGNISQWTNDSGYTSNLGTVTSVTAGDNTINSTGGTAPALNVIEANLTGIPAATAITGLATVATTGAYSDLSGTPTIPTDNNQLANGAGYTTNTGTVTSIAISGADGVDIDSGSPITTSGTITLGLSNIPNTSLANDSINIAGLTVELGAVNTPIDYSDLSNQLTGGNGIDITTGTITVDLAANPGLEFSNGELVLKTDATLSVGAGGASVVSTPGALTAALGGGFVIGGGGSFNGSGDLSASVDFGVTANDGTYTNASVTVSGNQVTNVTSGGAVGGPEEAFIRGYTVGDSTISSTTAGAAQELKFTTKMNTGAPNFTPIAEGCVLEVNQGSNITLAATLLGGVITINNAGTYKVTATIDATHDNQNQTGYSTFSVWMSRTDQGVLAEFAAGGNSMMPHGFPSMFQITGIAIFTGGTMSLHVGTTNENSVNDKLTTGTLATNQFAVTVSIEKIA